MSTTRRADGSWAQIHVRFKETPRKWKEETVDLLKENELQAILKYVLLSGGETGREMLKPFNMAQLSTRVFWSIARLYDGDVAAGIADLVPDEDWSFLDIRTRAMSKKAVEAKANEEEYKLWKQGRSQRGHKSPPEQPNPVAGRKTEAKSRAAADKAMKPDAISVDSSDEEEVKQEAAESKLKTGRTGGCDALDDELMQIAGAPIAEWLQKAGMTTRKELADASSGSAMRALVNPLDSCAQTLQDTIEKLINEARLDEVNDWMVEIVGDADLVGRLELQKLGTPADLLTTPNDLILQAVSSTVEISIQVIESWQKHAKRLVDQHPWLVEWRTL
ncbi:hypothetical protein BBJ29_000133 [Phytophthora kernoviae]|uniref:Uncharacterized protein n=1 Tax=Phytophthora kernoviae TaxID=325452 RepID=A0A3F2RIP4_9STRA|nr:hypothetical protein BBJ29_000133 [Phytophthora kernoviae]RLN58011.1 hypothetical protein BBP00_00007229 [Phytophthora kernoviae]